MSASMDLYAAAIAHRVRRDRDDVILPLLGVGRVRHRLQGATPTHVLLAHVCIPSAALDPRYDGGR